MTQRLLAIDVGNTEVKIGVFRGEALEHSWRVSTKREATEDEWSMILDGFFRMSAIDPSDIGAMILSSTVPPLTPVLADAARRQWGWAPLVVRPGIKTGMPVLYDNPQEVGADRIVNGVAAAEIHGAPSVVVDFGTATTFDCISLSKEYLGGVIAPGLGISADALFRRAARLPRVEVVAPDQFIGRNTQASMQSGIYNGYVALVDGVLDGILAEYGRDDAGGKPVVVATGGYASLIGPGCRRIDTVDPDLTLQGLRLIWERNR